eukprot:2575205-Amphidinium_carterae.1
MKGASAALALPNGLPSTFNPSALWEDHPIPYWSSVQQDLQGWLKDRPKISRGPPTLSRSIFIA